MVKRTMMAQLQSVSEGALGRIAQSPTTHRAVQSALQLKERVEKLVRGLEDVNERLAALEARVSKLEKAKRRTTRSSSASRPSATAKPAAAAPPDPAPAPETAPQGDAARPEPGSGPQPTT